MNSFFPPKVVGATDLSIYTYIKGLAHSLHSLFMSKYNCTSNPYFPPPFCALLVIFSFTSPVISLTKGHTLSKSRDRLRVGKLVRRPQNSRSTADSYFLLLPHEALATLIITEKFRCFSRGRSITLMGVGEKGESTLFERKGKKDPSIRSKTETHFASISEPANIVTKPF